MAAVTTGNIVAALGHGLLPIADVIAALSSGLFTTAAQRAVLFHAPICRRREFPVSRAETLLSERIHVGDVGTGLVLQITEWDEGDGRWVPVDISEATALTVILKRPDRTKLTKTAVLDTDGTDGKLRYDVIDGDLSASGTWRIQGRVGGVDGWSGASRESTFTVYSIL